MCGLTISQKVDNIGNVQSILSFWTVQPEYHSRKKMLKKLFLIITLFEWGQDSRRSRTYLWTYWYIYSKWESHENAASNLVFGIFMNQNQKANLTNHIRFYLVQTYECSTIITSSSWPYSNKHIPYPQCYFELSLKKNTQI